MINKSFIISLFICFLAASLGTVLNAQVHPNLILTKKGVTEIRNNRAKTPLFDTVLAENRAEVDAELAMGIDVPVPKDMAGGYTHERHKKNFFLLQKAGNLYQITGEEKYALYVRDMFLAYADLFPTLGLHPTNKSYATGKIFWQCLNDANWLVYCSQAYDCIYDFLSKKEREHLEKNLFRPYADFISIENPQFFNRVHNHSTWANAAVGMIGLVMNDKELIDRALFGIKSADIDLTMVDNDGGYITINGETKAGFFAQLDYSFSPDGHFTEGPYYLRYAMTPFLLFARALSNKKPELNIYAYRDSILQKSVYALLYETDAQGRFFPINDAQKGMSWNAREVVAAVDIAYADFGHDPMLLSIVEKQNKVQLDETGYGVAKDLAAGLAKPFTHKSILYRDGEDGRKGGLAILRNNNLDGEEICAVMKYAAHGMGHGHFDKLSYSLYDDDGEIIQDYGAARWVNIDQKGGGRYLPENNTFAKQSIAHNTLVINEISHYNGEVKAAENAHPDAYFFVVKNKAVQGVSAKEKHAYAGAQLQRTLILLEDENFRNPLLIDVFKVDSEKENQYDMPLWFMGHLLSTNFDYTTELTALKPLGNGHGYQHLWKEASGKAKGNTAQMTWFGQGKFYSINTAVGVEDELIFARGGANDQHFNLRHDPVIIHRKKATKSTVFASIIESHGRYNPVAEIPLSPFSGISNIEVLLDSEKSTIIQFSNQANTSWTVMISNQDSSETTIHSEQIGKETWSWTGAFAVEKVQK